jgi:hypothetical protein
MIARLRRGGPSRSHPTREAALEALREGRCLYAPTGSPCSGPPISVGLRHEEDANAVLSCKAHYGRLRRMDARTLDRLERHLLQSFGVEV